MGRIISSRDSLHLMHVGRVLFFLYSISEEKFSVFSGLLIFYVRYDIIKGIFFESEGDEAGNARRKPNRAALRCAQPTAVY